MAKVREERGDAPLGTDGRLGRRALSLGWQSSEHPRRAGIPAGILGWAAGGVRGVRGCRGCAPTQSPGRVRGRRSPLLLGHGKRAVGAAREAAA